MFKKAVGGFETSDLALASYLSLEGFRITDVYPSARDKKCMVFDGDGLKEAVDLFYGGEAKVNPLRYFNEIKVVKQRISHYEEDL